MEYPNFSEETRLRKKGYSSIVGLDESGRGPLAGPVVACAVALRLELEDRRRATRNLYGLRIRDSKLLTPRKREQLFHILVNHPNIEWATGRVSEKIIDRINILQATKLAMKRALINLEKKHLKSADFLILDGNIAIDIQKPQKAIIRADRGVFSCSIASIIAKVTRDRLMLRYDRKYPEYGFRRHKGYGTKIHFKMLVEHGPCNIHRRSFNPVKRLLQN